MSKQELTVANFMSQLVHTRQTDALRSVFEAFNVVDLAGVIEHMPVADAFFIFKILPKDESGELFSYLSNDKQEEFIRMLTGPELQEVLENLYTDDIVDFIGDMPEAIVNKVLRAASSETRADINLLLSYKENSCGSIMSTDYMTVSSGETIGQAMNQLRRNGRKAENQHYCYVLDSNRLVGVISLKSILFTPNADKVTVHMSPDVVKVKTSDDQEEAIRTMQKYDWSLIPVVDDEDKLVGIITADDVLDAMQDEATEDIQKMAGVTPITTSYLETRSFDMVKARIPWLGLMLLTNSFSSMIVGANLPLLVAYPILNRFTPMLMDTAGNAGSQASTMVVRGITVDDLKFKDFGHIMYKEARIALVCGLALGLLNMARIAILMPDVPFLVNLSTSLTVWMIVIAANLVGALLPLIAVGMHTDPAVMSTPILSTVTDIVSLSVYFALVKLLL